MRINLFLSCYENLIFGLAERWQDCGACFYVWVSHPANKSREEEEEDEDR